MNVFISWSGALSRTFGERLRAWLPEIFPGIKPFLSTHDIAKGSEWLATLRSTLEDTNVAIVVLTKENIHSDWILFECGAISKRITDGRLFTVLIDIGPAEVPLPLSLFQCTLIQKKNDFLLLLKALNSVPPQPVWGLSHLEKNLERAWPEFDLWMRDILATTPPTPGQFNLIAEELLLPSLYRQISAGNLDEAFESVQIAKRHGVAGYESKLGFIEAALARISGKSGASKSLLQIYRSKGPYSDKAFLELMLLKFSAGKHLDSELVRRAADPLIDPSTKAAMQAVISLWCAKESDITQARIWADRSLVLKLSNESLDIYRNIPLAICYLCIGDAVKAEEIFSNVKGNFDGRHQGYPFVSLLNELDKHFVNTCLGKTKRSLTKDITGPVRGHAWFLRQLAEVMAGSATALDAFSEMSRKWEFLIVPDKLSARLKKFSAQLIRLEGTGLFDE